jgi:uncharacterized membrane protein YgcG
MSTVGIERRWDRTARLGARIGLRGPLILLCAGLVFAAFFAIGRATRAGGTQAEGAASLPVASVNAAVPVRLQTATPIETTLLPPPPPRPSKARPFSVLVGSARLQTATPEASRAVTPAPRVPERVAPAPAPAPVRESTPAPPSRGGSSGGGGHHSSSGSGSGGGTFESSG